MQDCWISCLQIAERIGICIEQTERKIDRRTTVYDSQKFSAKWAPRLLTPKQERAWCSVQGQFSLFEADGNFFARFIATDESLAHHYQPETKEQSK